MVLAVVDVVEEISVLTLYPIIDGACVCASERATRGGAVSSVCTYKRVCRARCVRSPFHAPKASSMSGLRRESCVAHEHDRALSIPTLQTNDYTANTCYKTTRAKACMPKHTNTGRSTTPRVSALSSRLDEQVLNGHAESTSRRVRRYRRHAPFFHFQRPERAARPAWSA